MSFSLAFSCFLLVATLLSPSKGIAIEEFEEEDETGKRMAWSPSLETINEEREELLEDDRGRRRRLDSAGEHCDSGMGEYL